MPVSKISLKDLFPMIREREEIMSEIRSDPDLFAIYNTWKQEDQQYFLDICSGSRGVKMLLRQYKRVRDEMQKSFSYKNLAPVYTIVLMEKSPRVFHSFPDTYVHYINEASTSGIKLNMLQISFSFRLIFSWTSSIIKVSEMSSMHGLHFWDVMNRSISSN